MPDVSSKWTKPERFRAIAHVTQELQRRQRHNLLQPGDFYHGLDVIRFLAIMPREFLEANRDNIYKWI